MSMKKMAAAAALAAVSAFGLMGQADAATGVVNVNAVLAATPAFQQAGKDVVAEQNNLQKEFNDKSKNMSDKDKTDLAKQMNERLAKKENDVMKPIQDKLRGAVEKAAKDKKVDVVVAAGSLLYGKADVDLTEDVKANMK